MSKSEAPLPPLDAPTGGRRQQFEAQIAAVRIRTGKVEAERRLMVLGVVGLVAGPLICLLAYFIATGEAFTNDILELVVMGGFGIAVTIAGAVLFLRYSLARFLRFWLLRLIYEQQDLQGKG